MNARVALRPVAHIRGGASRRRGLPSGAAAVAAAAWLALVGSAGAQSVISDTRTTGDALPARVTGDLGVAVYSHRRAVPTDDRASSLLPYAVAEYQRVFARLDTIGIKTVPMGTGWLELVARVNFDGFRPDRTTLSGVGERSDSTPIGLGTLQRTAIGGLLLYAFQDVGSSGGQLYEAIWTGRMGDGAFRVYPQLGVDHRSRAYHEYYYGVTAAESAANGRISAYAPGSGTSPLAGLLAEYRIAGNLKAVGYLRRRWLPSAVTASPLVNRATMDSAFIGLAWQVD